MAVQARDLEAVGVLAVPGLAAEDVDTSRQGWRTYLDVGVPALVLLVMAAACFLWPLVYAVPSPIATNFAAANLFPGAHGHLLGTDPLGHDILSRILYGGRASFEVGFGAVAIGGIVGSTLGMTAGYVGGFLDTLIMRVLDVLLAFPTLVLAILVSEYLGPSEIHVIWAIAFFSIPAFARLARGHSLRLREFPFMVSSRLSGTPLRRIIFRHIVPNITPALLTFALLAVARAILVEAALSFLGLGIPPPAPSWGDMISSGSTYLASNPYLVLVPAIFLFVTTTALNRLGDALRARWSGL